MTSCVILHCKKVDGLYFILKMTLFPLQLAYLHIGAPKTFFGNGEAYLGSAPFVT